MIDRLLEQGYASTDIASALMQMLQGQAGEGGPAQAPAAPPKRFESAPAPVRFEKPPAPIAETPKARVAEPKDTDAPTKPVPDFARHFVKPTAAKPAKKPKFERKQRTGREPGFKTVRFNIGLAQGVTPAQLVGKIAGVTRLPAKSVGAIDLHEDHSLVDVEQSEVELVVNKLRGIRVLGVALEPAAV
jgi:ATP-dependent RNA helicase DeaD